MTQADLTQPTTFTDKCDQGREGVLTTGQLRSHAQVRRHDVRILWNTVRSMRHDCKCLTGTQKCVAHLFSSGFKTISICDAWQLKSQRILSLKSFVRNFHASRANSSIHFRLRAVLHSLSDGRFEHVGLPDADHSNTIK